jgi:hypothetical protein
LAPDAEQNIETVRQQVLVLLSPDTPPDAADPAPPRDGLSGMEANAAMAVLTRRLVHIEHAAGKVARLAARPVLEDQA